MKTERNNTFSMAICVLLVNILVLLVGVVFLNLEPHVPILVNIGIVLCFGLFLHIPWQEPVSYTHLDVYKRQPFALCVNANLRAGTRRC